MSAAQQPGEWDVIHEEPDEDDTHDHAATAMQAAAHAADSHKRAAKAADQAEKHAGRLDEVEDLLSEARDLAKEMRGLSETNMRMLDGAAKMIGSLVEAIHTTHKEAMEKLTDAMSAPRKIVRDKEGRATGVERG